MYIFRIRTTPFIAAANKHGAGRSSPDSIVVISRYLNVDSHGECAILHDQRAQETKYLFIGKSPLCLSCAKCSERPLMVDSIIVDDASTELELKSRYLNVSDQAKKFFSDRGMRLSFPLENTAPREHRCGRIPAFGDTRTAA